MDLLLQTLCDVSRLNEDLSGGRERERIQTRLEDSARKAGGRSLEDIESDLKRAQRTLDNAEEGMREVRKTQVRFSPLFSVIFNRKMPFSVHFNQKKRAAVAEKRLQLTPRQVQEVPRFQRKGRAAYVQPPRAALFFLVKNFRQPLDVQFWLNFCFNIHTPSHETCRSKNG